MKNHLMLGAAASALLFVTAGQAFAADAPAAEAAPAAAPADASEVDAVIIIGQGQSRQIQTLKDDAIGLEAAGTSALKAIDKLPGVTFQSAEPLGLTNGRPASRSVASTRTSWASPWTAFRWAT